MSAVRLVARIVLPVAAAGALTLTSATGASAAPQATPTAPAAQAACVTEQSCDVALKRDWLITLRGDAESMDYESLQEEVLIGRRAEQFGLEVADWHYGPRQIVVRGSARKVAMLRYDAHVAAISMMSI